MEDPNTSQEIVKAILGIIPQDTIFVANLPDNFSIPELKEVFKKYGELKDVRIPTDRKTGKLKNFAFITFKKEEDTKKVVKEHKINF